MVKLKRSMLKLAIKQLRKHYSETEEHLICLTCEAIVSKGLTDSFLVDLKHIKNDAEFTKQYIDNYIRKWEKINIS